MRVAIMGGTGFVGKSFLRLYSEKFHEVVLLTRTLQAASKLQKSTNLKIVLVNYQDEGSIENALKGVDAVVNLIHDNELLDENIRIARKVISAIGRIGSIDCFVHISSFSVYDALQEGELTEASPELSSKEPYGKSKLAVQNLYQKTLSRDVRLVVLQPTVVCGPDGNWFKHASHVNANFNHLRLPYSGNGYCNIVNVEDVASAIYLAINLDLPVKTVNSFPQVYLINGATISWGEFYRALRKPEYGNVHYSELSNPHLLHKSTVLSFILRHFFGYFGSFVYALKSKIAKNKNAHNVATSSMVDATWEPKLYGRLVHSCKFKVPATKAKEHLGFLPQDVKLFLG